MATTPLCASVFTVDVRTFSSHRHMYGMGERGMRVGMNVVIGCMLLPTKCCTHKWAKGACASSGERHGMYMRGGIS